MNSLREYAFQAWVQEKERRKQADRKKRKRRAKKIEEDIEDLLPRDIENLRFDRNLDDARWEATVTVTDADESTLLFTYDSDGDLVLIGQCRTCHEDTISCAIGSAAELGEILENFTPSSSHECTRR
ncbi:MAG TPA: hypothetical protein VKN18_24785 [Blastocatellia bacterium]|nr:hypothetical protein [Blastocatellia bacterium]